jgi:hypothetical protein
MKAILVTGNRAVQSVRRMGCGNKQNARDREMFRSRARDAEMGVIDRIEGAAKNRQTRNGYTRSMVTVLILTSFFGRSCESRGVFDIFSTIS